LKILSKAEERTIIAIHRRLQANEFEIYHLIKDNHNFKVYLSVSTIYRTFKRYPLKKKRITKIKRYEFTTYTSQKAKDTHFFETILKNR